MVVLIWSCRHVIIKVGETAHYLTNHRAGFNNRASSAPEKGVIRAGVRGLGDKWCYSFCPEAGGGGACVCI